MACGEEEGSYQGGAACVAHEGGGDRSVQVSRMRALSQRPPELAQGGAEQGLLAGAEAGAIHSIAICTKMRAKQSVGDTQLMWKRMRRKRKRGLDVELTLQGGKQHASRRNLRANSWPRAGPTASACWAA